MLAIAPSKATFELLLLALVLSTRALTAICTGTRVVLVSLAVGAGGDAHGDLLVSVEMGRLRLARRCCLGLCTRVLLVLFEECER